VPLFSREIKARPWDRFPSEAFLVIDRALLAPGFIIGVAFSMSPLAAWNFHFPTEGEKLVWRVCAVYHAVYSTSVAVYYIYCALLEHKGASKKGKDSQPPPRPLKVQQPGGAPVPEETQPGKVPVYYEVEAGVDSSEQTGVKPKGLLQASIIWLRSLRNISPDGDPDMELSLRATLPTLLGTFLYMFCRVFFYVEDFVSIREQPVGVYTSMNKFIPFMP
jgi:hypothetical protein